MKTKLNKLAGIFRIQTILIITIGICTYFTNTGLAQEKYGSVKENEKTEVFLENFNNNNNQWPVGKRSNYYCEILNGNIFCKKRGKWGGTIIKSIPLDNEKFYEIEFTSKIIKGSLNFLWGYADSKNTYILSFNIHEKPNITLKFKKNSYYGKTLFSVNVESTDRIAEQFNKFIIRKKNTNIYVFFNEELIGLTQDQGMPGDKIGFDLNKKDQIYFDELNVYYLKYDDNTAFNKALGKYSIESFQDFIENYKNDSLKKKAEDFIEKIVWEEKTNRKDTTELKNFIDKYPNSEYSKIAKKELEQLISNAKTKSRFFSLIPQHPQLNNIENLIKIYKDSSYSKQIYFYSLIDQAESLTKNQVIDSGIGDRFHISDIKPKNNEENAGKCVIIGDGNLPVSEECCEKPGEGAVLKLITPYSEWADVNFILGKPKYALKNIRFDPDNPSFGELDMSPNFAPGAIWLNVGNIFIDGELKEGHGVSFYKGIRIGAYCNGDTNIVIDYISAGRDIVIIPAATNGSIHRLIGKVRIGQYIFESSYDPIYPLTFMLDNKFGYVYLRGKGKVILPDGKEINF